jgi:hypothetical protein
MDPDPDPTPDPTPFFINFKNAKKKISYFFLITYPQTHYLQSLKPNADETALKSQKRISVLATINGLGCSILSKKSQTRCTLLNTFMRQGKDPDPEPDPDSYL